MMKVFCKFVTTPKKDILSCTVCLRERASQFPPEKTFRLCKPIEIKRSIEQMITDGDWGDVTEELLCSIGMTKEWWSKLIKGKCKCPERQSILNAAGRWLVRKAKGG